MIGSHVFLNTINHPIDLDMYTSITIMIDSTDMYVLVMQAFVLGYFYHCSAFALLSACFSPFLFCL